MKRNFAILLTAMILMDLIDGDFAALSVLDIIKIILYVVCFILIAKEDAR